MAGSGALALLLTQRRSSGLRASMQRRYRNRYFVLRHGRSIANESGMIVSDPKRGVPGFGLSPAGRVAVEAFDWPGRLAELGIVPRDVTCLSSDFLRALETAVLFSGRIGIPAPEVSPLLRERGFGSLDGQSHERYHEIWEADRLSAHHHLHGAESCAEVRDRLSSLLSTLEGRFAQRCIVLVAHGDVLQILQAAFSGLAPNRHRELPHLEPAELRPLPDV